MTAAPAIKPKKIRVISQEEAYEFLDEFVSLSKEINDLRRENLMLRIGVQKRFKAQRNPRKRKPKPLVYLPPKPRKSRIISQRDANYLRDECLRLWAIKIELQRENDALKAEMRGPRKGGGRRGPRRY